MEDAGGHLAGRPTQTRRRQHLVWNRPPRPRRIGGSPLAAAPARQGAGSPAHSYVQGSRTYDGSSGPVFVCRSRSIDSICSANTSQPVAASSNALFIHGFLCSRRALFGLGRSLSVHIRTQRHPGRTPGKTTRSLKCTEPRASRRVGQLVVTPPLTRGRPWQVLTRQWVVAPRRSRAPPARHPPARRPYTRVRARPHTPATTENRND
jgi:hypothetical protein